MSKLLRKDLLREDNSYQISQLKGGGLVGEPATDNLKIGTGALSSLTTGDRNVAIGRDALNTLTEVSELTAIGYQSLYSNTTGTGNVAIGYIAFYSNTEGHSSVAIGNAALYTNTEGIQNVGIGTVALYNCTSGDYNIAIGYKTLYDVTNAQYNVAIGRATAQNITTGDNNIAIGGLSLDRITTANDNVAVGHDAGGNTRGSGNVYLGNEAGAQHDGSNELFIDNHNAAAPLIWGDFANHIIDINGTLKVNGAELHAPLVYPFFIFGNGGFVESGGFGAQLIVAFADVNASINSSLWVHDGGNFKVRIIHGGSANNGGKIVGGVMYINYDVDGGIQSWDIGPVDFNLPCGAQDELMVDDSGAAYTIASNSKVGLYWAKDDNAGGAAGTFAVMGIVLVRQ